MFDPRPDSQGRTQQLALGLLSALVLLWALTSAAHADTLKVTHLHPAPASRPAIKEDRVMDNMAFDITAEGTDALTQALALAFGEYRQANGWCVDYDGEDNGPRLVLASQVDERFTQFLTAQDAEHAVGVVTAWLEEVDYGEEPDHDGSNGKGWRVYCDQWGHVGEYRDRAFVAIEPRWAMYGK
jgi:hypothetical protein